MPLILLQSSHHWPGYTPCLVQVMGSEGRGLRTLVRRCCHSLLKVDTPIDADVPGLDSLNVGVAGGIIMHRLLLNQRLG